MATPPKKPYTPPKLRFLSLDDVRELERRYQTEIHGVLGNEQSCSSSALPKKNEETR